MSATRWLDSLNQGGDAHLGAALLRLSRQAAALHQAAAIDPDEHRSSPRAAEPALTAPYVASDEAVRMEVDR